jgi:hypothetical protein
MFRSVAVIALMLCVAQASASRYNSKRKFFCKRAHSHQSRSFAFNRINYLFLFYRFFEQKPISAMTVGVATKATMVVLDM